MFTRLAKYFVNAWDSQLTTSKQNFESFGKTCRITNNINVLAKSVFQNLYFMHEAND